MVKSSPGDVTDQHTGVGGHTKDENGHRPQPHPKSDGQIVEFVGHAQVVEDLLEDEDRS